MSALWRTFYSVLLIITMASTPLLVEPSHAVQKRLPADLRTLITQGQPTDELPLIITLTNPLGLEGAQATRAAKEQRRDAVRRAQIAFVQRQTARITRIKGQTVVTPMLFVTAKRANLETIYNDTDVVSMTLDRATPLAMYDSSVLIGLEVSHNAGFDGTGTSVAVLDTGVLSGHEFLSGQVIAEACFSTNSGYSTSYCPGGVSSSTAVGSGAPCTGLSGCTHGTHVAGTIAGKAITTSGGVVTRGVAPGAKIIAVQVFSYFPGGTAFCSSSSGCLASWDSDQIAALDWLYDNAATPSWGTLASVNMSLGGSTKNPTHCDGDARKAYVDQLRTIGVATVIASGNSGYTDGVSSPACISTAIAVGATRLPKYGLTADVVASFSNAPTIANNGVLNANNDRLLDLLAPGQYVHSAVSSSTTAYAVQSGTSMATPHVAGAWAVLKQVSPTASVQQVLDWLYQSGVTIRDSRNSLELPRISVFAAINTALGYSAVAVTATNTATPTATITPTYTSSPTATITPTYTSSPTATNMPIVTVSQTPKPSSTRTPTRTALPRPAAFSKIGPANGILNRARPVVLTWSASRWARSYEYCIATTGPACTNWRNVGLNRRVTVYGLKPNTVYIWQVRARNIIGVTNAANGRWRFTTKR